MTSNVTYLKTVPARQMEELGIAVAMLDAMVAQMARVGLAQEADVLEGAMKEIWQLTRQRYAQQVENSLVAEGNKLDEDDRSFIQAVCAASPESVKRMLDIVVNAEKSRT